MSRYLFTSESVTEGHPDKVCDAISDAILDDLLRQDPESRVACETLATKGLVVVSGEVSTHGYVEVEKIVRDVLNQIGYTDVVYGMEHESVKIITSIHEQSPHIAQGVDETADREQGAGDQGLMFGFACKDTPELMPLPIQLAQRLTERLATVRKNGTLDWLGPDGKSQVTVEYENDIPTKVKKVVIATQHLDLLEQHKTEQEESKFVSNGVINEVIKPVLDKYDITYDEDFIVNGTGRFVKGGPEADTGLTGRKIIVDTYGGYAPHGGGAFSGKDPSKVDRSATYMARYIAKNIVAAGLADQCEVQLSYAIGLAYPVSVFINTFGSGKLSDEAILALVKKNFDMRPKAIIEHLKLLRPIYRKTAAFGHFGRNDPDFTWEKTDKAEELAKALIDKE